MIKQKVAIPRLGTLPPRSLLQDECPRTLIPLAHVVTASLGVLPAELVFGPKPERSPTAAPPQHETHASFETFTWSPAQAVDVAKLSEMLAKLPDHIHRVKDKVIDSSTGAAVLVQRVGRRCRNHTNIYARKGLVSSTGQRKGCIEPIRGRCITKCFSWARIQLQGHLVEIVLAEG